MAAVTGDNQAQVMTVGGVHVYMGRGSQARMLAAAKAGGLRKFAAVDVASGASGAKGWLHFASHVAMFEYVMSLPEANRCVYELVVDTTPVRFWADIEFIAPDLECGEVRRAHLEGLLKTAIKESFGLAAPVMFWGTSTRRVAKGGYKHSYQLRVPSIVFENNNKDGTLGKWFAQFIQLTREDPLLLCPETGRHIVDPLVYSRSRCVRAAFCAKRSDAGRTPLTLMQGVGDSARVNTDLEAFEALLVEPCVDYPGDNVLRVSGSPTMRCLGVGNASLLAPPFAEGAEAGSKRRAPAGGGDSRAGGGAGDGGVGGGGARKRARVGAGPAEATAPRVDRSCEVVELLAVLGQKTCEDYETWRKVMFACRNMAGGSPMVREAFIEWSKRAHSFTDNADVGGHFDKTDPREPGADAGPAFNMASLQKWARDDPFIFYKTTRVQLFDSNGSVSTQLEWGNFLENVDVRKSSWRCVVRAARLLWPDKRSEVVEDVVAQMAAHGVCRVTQDDVGRVWDYVPCTNQVFVDAVVKQIKQQLVWPQLVTKTLPTLLGCELGRRFDVVSYTFDGGSTLDIVMKDSDVEDSEPETFLLKMADGQVQGHKLNLMSTAFMFAGAREPGGLNPEYNLELQYTWSQRIGEVPDIRRNFRVVNQSSWFVFREETCLWDELLPKHPRLKQRLSEVVRAYFEPLLTFLDFKSAFDPISDVRRQKLEKIRSRFGNNEHLEKILDALQADPEICVNEYNDVFNRDPFVLPCANGLLDFRTLELREVRREDFVTYRTPAEWKGDAATEGATGFLNSLWPKDTHDVVAFVKAWFGYCLTGLTQMQILVFMIGLGSNGKSKLSLVMENILGKVGFGHVTYEALCQRTGGPNEELFEARNARMWQVDENDGDQTLNFAQLKRITGEDTIRVRQLYGHVVKVPSRAKINFCVNKAPKLPNCSDMKEQASLWRRFVYVDFPCQFVDFSDASKDREKIEALRREMSDEDFRLCVKPVDINLDPKLEGMTSAFLRLFAEAIHAYIRVDARGRTHFEPIPIPACIQRNVGRMMRANPSLKAADWLNTVYEAGVPGDVLMRTMYTGFLASNELFESNFPYSRFDTDVQQWISQQNAQNPNCRTGAIVQKAKVLTGDLKGQTIVKNVCPIEH